MFLGFLSFKMRPEWFAYPALRMRSKKVAYDHDYDAVHYPMTFVLIGEPHLPEASGSCAEARFFVASRPILSNIASLATNSALKRPLPQGLFVCCMGSTYGI